MKISLAINSRKPVKEWIEKCILTAAAFDEIVIYLDEESEADQYNWPGNVLVICDGLHRSVVDGFNIAVDRTTGDWVCAFCDDDFFLPGALGELICKIKAGEFSDCDVVHFPVFTGGGVWGRTKDVTFDAMLESNKIPCGSFFRKGLFYTLNGYQVEECSDWDFWLRALAIGYRFRYFDKAVYTFRTGHARSLTSRLIAELGQGKIRELVLANLDKSRPCGCARQYL